VGRDLEAIDSPLGQGVKARMKPDAPLLYRLRKVSHMILVLALVLGVVAGLRAMTSPAAASWAAHLGLVTVAGTPLSFMGATATPYIFSLLALGELINDKLPNTPSRKVPPQFIARVVSGALVGATVSISSGQWIVGALVGAVGAVIGTYGGAYFRQTLTDLFKSPLAAALTEDAVAILLAAFAVVKL
jgi:uncharacterized membrane protein